MSVVNIIMEARAAGVQLCVEGDDLLLGAGAPPPPAVLELLSRHKPAIVAWLRPGADGWSAEDWHAYFDERAGIAELDGGLPRDQADARALDCCNAEWLEHNPMRSPPGRCLGCGDGDHTNEPLVPFGTESAGHVWLHRGCWKAWYEGRKAAAMTALGEMGIHHRGHAVSTIDLGGTTDD